MTPYVVREKSHNSEYMYKTYNHMPIFKDISVMLRNRRNPGQRKYGSFSLTKTGVV